MDEVTRGSGSENHEATSGNGSEPHQATPGEAPADNGLYSGSKHVIQGAGENVHEAKEAVTKAADSIKDLVSGKANIVDAALAVKGAYDNVMGLSGRLSATAMMPVMKALAAFKGQAFLPAGKQMDPVLGIDVHMVTIPPSPAPVPLPHPYIGILFNAKDWVSCLINTFKTAALDTLPPPKEGEKGVVASVAKNKEAIAGIAMGLMGMSASVKFGGIIPRAITGTHTKSIPHIPFGAGWYAANDAAVAKNIGKAFLGSLFVVADGDPMVGSFHLNYDCWDVGVVDVFKGRRASAKKAPEPGEAKAELFVPSGTVLPIPMGRPVLVNSIPTPFNPLTILDKLFKAGLGKLKAAAKKGVEKGLTALRGKVDCDTLSAVSAAIGTGQSHPVDVSGGYFYTNNEDFKLPGPIPFIWERTWYSNSNYNGPLGRGWHHSYDMALAIDDESQKAILRMKDGRVAIFDIPTLDKESYNRSEKLTLYVHEDGYYYVSDVKSLLYRFTNKLYKSPINNRETFLLQSVANRNGFAIRFFYTDNAILNKIIDSANRIIIINSDINGRIINVQLPDPAFNGRTTFAATSYSYANDGYMVQQSNALNQSMYFEYKGHLMVKETWRNGCIWQFRYDKEKEYDAKCIEVWGTGNLLHYKFDYTDPACTIATNSRGFKKKFYHKNGVVIKYVDALGAEWDYHYNQFNELEWEIDPLGNQKTKTYDKWGNVESVTEANRAFTQRKCGDGFLRHFPIEIIDKAGGKWNWVYDSAGNIIKRTNSVMAVTEYLYEDGLLKTIINAKGGKTHLEYDVFYNLIKVVSRNGYERYWNYDVLGNCTRLSDSNGKTRKTEFNRLSFPEKIYKSDGEILNFKTDSDGNIIHLKSTYSEIYRSYDYLNHLILFSQAGHTMKYKYDTEGILIELTNEHKEVYSFENDPAGRVIKEIGFDGLIRKYKRNEIGKIIRVQKNKDKIIDYAYNENGNIVELDFNDSTFIRYKYSREGLLIEAQNNNSTIKFERDVYGRITKEINPEGYNTYQYDILNHRIRLTSSLGANIYNEFDDFGNVISNSSEDWHSEIKYDNLGFEIERFFPGNISSNLTRDKLGRPIRQQIKNKSLSLHYRQYKWDINYRLERVTDSESGITDFFYDEIGNLSKTIFSNGSEQLRNPDEVGNLYDSEARSDRKYGKSGKLLRANGIVFHYDDEGNLVEKKEADGKKWSFVWNACGTLSSVTKPDGDIVSFTYDALGRRLTKRYKNTTTKWTWDGNKPLHEWKENIQSGKVLGISSGDKDQIITWLFDEMNFTPIAKLKSEKKYSIISDCFGTPYQIYNIRGEKIMDVQLDSYGKTRTSKGDKNTCPFRYQGQYEDAETGLYYNRFRYYDPGQGFYISQDPIKLLGGSRFYSYVNNPNKFIDPFGLNKCTVTKVDAEDHDIVLTISRKDYPEATEHIEDSIKSGRPDILTIDREGADARRGQSLAGVPRISGTDRDEYPPAMFAEGGSGATIRHIDPSDNRGAGSAIGNGLRGQPDGTRVKVVVVD